MKNDRIKELLEKALNILRTVTKSTTQTFVSGLKKQGAFSKECQEEAMTMSKSKALAMFGEEVVKAIEKEYGDVDTWLTENIESILHDDKKGKE